MFSNRISDKLMAAAALITCVGSCTKNADSCDKDLSSLTTLQLSTGCGELQTRTWIDFTGASAEFPVYWSDGDKVMVNGVVSSPISIGDGEKISRTDFSVRNVTAPFTVFYPAGACRSIDDDGLITFDIPQTQDYVPDSFGCGAAMLYGCSESEDAPVELKNLCGAVCVTLSDESAVISSVSLTSLGDAPISGGFTLDSETGNLNALAGGCEVKLVLPEGGVQLTSAGTRFVFTIPAGDYPDGFRLRFEDQTRHILKNYWLRPAAGAPAGVTVAAGHIVCFEARPYEPDAREIMDAADWTEFAAAYTAGNWQKEWLGKDGVVRIGADFTTSSLQNLNAFSGIIDGQGFTITQTSAQMPLFGDLTGTVRNLTLAGRMTSKDPGNAGAAVFAKSMSGNALIQNCCNECEVSVSSFAGKCVAAAFVRSFNGGSIVDCVNDAQLKITVDFNSASYPLVVGGFAGTVASLSSPAVMRNCTNNQKISVIVSKSASVGNAPAQAGFGGFVGTVVSGDADNYLSLEGCVNNGDISVDYSVPNTGAVSSMSAVGGIVGSAVKYNSTGKVQSYYARLKDSYPDEDGVCMVMSSCVNNGNIYNGMVSNCSSDDPCKSFCGGLAGILNGCESARISVTSCEDYGKVVGSESAYSRSALCVVAGGLCGFGGYVDFNGCKVVSKQIGSIKRQAYSAAMGIGYAMMSFSLRDCWLYADIQHIRCTNYSDDNYGIAFNLSTKLNTQGGVWWPFIKIDDSEVCNCHVGGSFILSKDVVAYNASTPSTTATTVITASNMNGFISSPSFAVDYDRKGFPSKVIYEGNVYWDGK